MPTFGSKSDARQTRVRSRSSEDLVAKTHWKFRSNSLVTLLGFGTRRIPWLRLRRSCLPRCTWSRRACFLRLMIALWIISMWVATVRFRRRRIAPRAVFRGGNIRFYFRRAAAARCLNRSCGRGRLRPIRRSRAARLLGIL